VMIRESASGIINCFKTGSVLIDGSLGLLKESVVDKGGISDRSDQESQCL